MIRVLAGPVKTLFGGTNVEVIVPKGARPAASSHGQWGNRAAHFTTKAHIRPTGKFRRWLWPSPEYEERHVRTVWLGTGEAVFRTIAKALW